MLKKDNIWVLFNKKKECLVRKKKKINNTLLPVENVYMYTEVIPSFSVLITCAKFSV